MLKWPAAAPEHTRCGGTHVCLYITEVARLCCDVDSGAAVQPGKEKGGVAGRIRFLTRVATPYVGACVCWPVQLSACLHSCIYASAQLGELLTA
jgi:hypothetical protein